MKEKYYDSLAKNATDSVQAKYEKKKARAIKKYLEGFDRRTKDMMNKEQGKPVKKRVVKVKVSKMTQKAYREFQKYTKLIRIKNGMVYLVDKMRYAAIGKGVVAGHCWSKKNYPQLAFEIDNVRPITSMTNKRQMENTGWDWICNTGLSQERIDELERMANDKSLKNILRDSNYYFDIYIKYKQLNTELERQIESQKAL